MANRGNRASVAASGMLEKKWEETQKKTFTKWCNLHLNKRAMTIESIHEEFQDGIKLINLLEVIGQEPLGKYNRTPKMKIHYIQNINLALEYLKRKDVKLIMISAEDIVDQNLKLILGMVWTIILRFQIADISEEELSAKEALLLWCKKKCAPYSNVSIDNFTTSWQDGLGFCALIHAHRPDLIPYSTLTNGDPAANLKLAFEVADKELGIAQLLDIEDIIDVPKPDERSIMTYIALYYHVFASSRKTEVAARRVGKLVDLTQANDALKENYTERASKHADWVKDATNRLEDRDWDNTLDGIKQLIDQFNDFKQNEKPPKQAERVALETLNNAIAVKLNNAGRPPFKAPAGLSIEEIGKLWSDLDAAQQARNEALLEELARQNKLDLLKRRFNNNAKRLDEWNQKQADYLNHDEPVDSINEAQTKLMLLDAFDKEYIESKSRPDDLQALADELVQSRDKDADSYKTRANELATQWGGLQPLAGAKRDDLNAKLKRQQEMEALRKRFAESAKDYKHWEKDAETDVRDTTFGVTLEAVEAFGETLDADDASKRSQNDDKKGQLDGLWGELQALGVTDNRYTVLTNGDIASLHTQLETALGQRRDAYANELAHQQALEAKRKEFAAQAQAFVDSIDTRKKSIEALEGEPEPLSAAIRETYADGAPENEKLSALSALQDEMGRLGITDNRHTKYTMPVLGQQNAAFARWVAARLAQLHSEREDKNGYAGRAQALVHWIDNTIPRVNARNFDNTLEGARDQRQQWTLFKNSERAQKGVEKLNTVALFEKTNTELAALGRPPFVAPEGLSPDEINRKWDDLETAEKAYEQALDEELSRQERLAGLVRSFTNEADDLEAWAARKEEYLNTVETVTTLDDAHLKLLQLNSNDEEYQARQGRLDGVRQLSTDINDLRYIKADEVRARAEALAATWARLAELSAAKRKALTEDQAREQKKEGLRVDFANKARDYTKFVKDAETAVDDHNFGITLADVEAYRVELDASTSAISGDNNAKRDVLDGVWSELQSNGVSDNRHTPLTNSDVAALHTQLADALAKRNGAYDAELARQRENDGLRREFADKAQSFVDWLASQREAVNATEGEPAVRSEAVRAIHQDGQPGRQRLDAIHEFNTGLQQRGIFTNEYTPHSTQTLETSNKLFNDAVANLLASILEEKEMNERGEAQAAEWKRKEGIEEQRIDFHNRCKALDAWMDHALEILTDPINVDSIEGVNELRAAADQLETERNAKQPDYASLVDAEVQLQANGAEVSLAPITEKWNETEATIASRKEALAAELARQTANDALCRDFADKALVLESWLKEETRALADASQGELESQLPQVQSRQGGLANGKDQLGALATLSDQIQSSGIRTNKYTDLTHNNLKAQYLELESAVDNTLSLLQKELLAKQESTASPEQIDEFKEVFRHFDKNNNGVLRDFEFKSCLNSLGEDPSDAEMGKIMQQIGNGQGLITFERFVEFMIQLASDNITQNEIAESFREIAADKDFVTEDDLRRALPGEKVDYLIKNMPTYDSVPGAFDYRAWASAAFSR